MKIPHEFITYLVHFHSDRDYFECHEILEEYWKEVEPGKKDSVWVGFIQVAVGCYHHRRENWNGAQKALNQGLTFLTLQKHRLPELGIDLNTLQITLTQALSRIENREPYQSFALPLTPEVEHLARSMATALNLKWMQPSDFTKKEIIHRHILRDRTEVIEERQKAIEERKNRNAKNQRG